MIMALKPLSVKNNANKMGFYLKYDSYNNAFILVTKVSNF